MQGVTDEYTLRALFSVCDITMLSQMAVGVAILYFTTESVTIGQLIIIRSQEKGPKMSLERISLSTDCRSGEISRALKRIKHADTICILNVLFGRQGRLDLLNMYLFKEGKYIIPEDYHETIMIFKSPDTRRAQSQAIFDQIRRSLFAIYSQRAVIDWSSPDTVVQYNDKEPT